MTSGTPLTDFALNRFSPLRFDGTHTVTPTDLSTLLDAARRAPSAGNAQPWRFVVAHRGDDHHRRLVPHLARSSAQWAPEASVLLVAISHRWVEDTDLEYSEFAHYDLGQAVAHLTFQAWAMGLAVHQFRAFDKAGITAAFGVPEHLEVTTIAAIGRPADDAANLSGAGTSRERRSVAEVTWPPAHQWKRPPGR
ncbi:nitroreductase family protein [Nocardioides jejuensis]|uniref:Nitroreductase n=1 Tax=Nocardioides jejuensis TaxID=2502782 RepID=A0A4R1BVH0_9ACTN|nr:nitroreductase family protein [Nocardioides jejuensis]TCJ21989.1 nitroreductase [Nocardioides jejuensis]